MTHHEMELILLVVKQHMDQELRRKVMASVPHAYNAWVGAEVMETRAHTVGASPGRVIPNPEDTK